MVERLSEEPRPVQLPHGIGRHPDGDTVPCPVPPPTRRQLAYGWVCFAIVVLVAAAKVLYGALR